MRMNSSRFCGQPSAVIPFLTRLFTSAECLTLRAPVHRQILAELIEREFRRLSAVENRLDKVRREKGAAEDPPDIARHYTVFPSDRPQRGHLPRKQPFMPSIRAG